MTYRFTERWQTSIADRLKRAIPGENSAELDTALQLLEQRDRQLEDYLNIVDGFAQGWRGDGFAGAVGPVSTVETVLNTSSAFDAARARRVKVSVNLTNTFTVLNDLFSYNIRRGTTIGGTLIKSFSRHVLVAGGLWTPVELFTTDLPPAGSTQYVVTVIRASGTGACTTVADASSTNEILVEDIGT